MDKEFIVLEEINENQHISQRQLSQKTGLSLGSVNLLLKKMIKEGLIKIETIPANRVIYMLTPKGMAEKANKTYKYMRHHYRMIEEAKQKIKDTIVKLLQKNPFIYIVLTEDEISLIVKASIEELDIKERIILINDNEEMQQEGVLLTLNSSDYEKYKELCNNVIVNLGERL